MTMHRVAGVLCALLALISICGCNRVHTTYEPATASQPSGRLTRLAVRFYEQDIEVIARAGGVVIGSIEAKGNGFSSFGSVKRASLKAAAARGGTHIILSNKDVETAFAQVAPGRVDVNCDGSRYGSMTHVRCSGTHTDPTYLKIQKPMASYVVVRVPCENWSDLPAELRPQPIDGVTCERWASPRPSPDKQRSVASSAPHENQDAAHEKATPGRVEGTPFPDRVAGFAFGITAEEFQQTCKHAGGVTFADAMGPACSKPAAWIPFPVDGVAAVMCEDRSCGYRLLLPTTWQRAEALRLREILQTRYGAPHDASTPNEPRCPSEASLRSHWLWLNEKGVHGMLQLIYPCRSEVAAPAYVFYGNERSAAMYVASQRNRKNDW